MINTDTRKKTTRTFKDYEKQERRRQKVIRIDKRDKKGETEEPQIHNIIMNNCE